MRWQVTLDANVTPWAILAFMAGAAYTGLVWWMNHHRRYGRYWARRHSIQVVLGVGMTILLAWPIFGWQDALAWLVLFVVTGAPQLVAATFGNVKEEAEADEAELVRHGKAH